MGKTLMIGIGGAGCELATHLQKEFTVRTIAIDTNKKGLARCGIQEQLLLDAGVEVLGYDQNEAICEGGVHAPLIATLTRAYGESRARLISFLYQALN